MNWQFYIIKAKWNGDNYYERRIWSGKTYEAAFCKWKF